MDMKLEAVVIGVSDVDRAKQFYKGLGWREDADFPIDEDFRVVQLTPPGSPCSVQFGLGLPPRGPVRSRCSWPFPTSRRPAPNWSPTARTSARSSTTRAAAWRCARTP